MCCNEDGAKKCAICGDKLKEFMDEICLNCILVDLPSFGFGDFSAES